MALIEDLQAAAKAGLIAPEQVGPLSHFMLSRIDDGGDPRLADLPPDEGERFKLVGGFNDIFVAIGIVLVYGALLGFLGAGTIANPVALLAASAAIAWGLAEIFTARMRLALPSILLSLIFCVSAGGLVAIAIGPSYNSNLWDTLSFATSHAALTPGIAIIVAAGLHFWRFRVPINVAIMVAAVFGTILTLIAQNNMALLMSNGNIIILGVGLMIFAIAMTFDMSDPFRRTWRSDAAFWLHMLAAPAIVHPAVFGLAGGPTQLMEGSPSTILMLFAVFSVIAIIIDRRALIVSALAYAGGAIGYYLNDNLFGGTGFTVLALGAVILALSAGWKSIRKIVLPVLPLGRFKEKLPPI
jgi:hypothetical protein